MNTAKNVGPAFVGWCIAGEYENERDDHGNLLYHQDGWGYTDSFGVAMLERRRSCLTC